MVDVGNRRRLDWLKSLDRRFCTKMMDEKTRQLVQTITEQVIKTLQGGGQDLPRQDFRGPSGSPDQTPPAVIRPPIGVCTGDYSKFPELAGRSVGASPPTSPTAPAMATIPLSGIVTASQLQEAMNLSPDGVATLTNDARLTPLANDLVRQHPDRVCRTPGTPPVPPGSPAVGTSPGRSGAPIPGSPADWPWFWWIDGSCPAVHELTSARAGSLRSSGAARHPAALAQVVRDLAGALKSQPIAGGLLFVHNAARAMCFANRCAAIRAVVGTCGEAVEQGIAELGANVLVIEYPHQGPRAMEAMVDRVMQQQPQPPPTIQRELADLHRC